MTDSAKPRTNLPIFLVLTGVCTVTFHSQTEENDINKEILPLDESKSDDEKKTPSWNSYSVTDFDPENKIHRL